MKQSALSNNIFAIRTHFGHTQESLADLLGVSQTTVSNWETSGHSVSNKNIETIMSKLPVSRDDIVSETNGFAQRINQPSIPGARRAIGVATVKVPLLGRVHAGPAGDPDVYEETSEQVEINASYAERDPEVHVLDYEGDCMNKVFGEGTTSLVVSPNSPFGNGDIVVAVIDDTEYVVRKLEQTAKELRLKPCSWNPSHDDIVVSRSDEHHVDFKGKVLECFKRFD